MDWHKLLPVFWGAPPVKRLMVKILVSWPFIKSSVYVIAGAAFLAVLMSFIGKISALLRSIPLQLSVAYLLLFGVIALAA